jgi:hypothetical protein
MAENKQSGLLPVALTYDDVRSVSPALEHYMKETLLDGVWKRPELSPLDRSVVTVASLIARIQMVEMPYHFALALDNGVKPSEIITHHASRLLRRMGECDVGCCGGEGHLPPPRHRRGPRFRPRKRSGCP